MGNKDLITKGNKPVPNQKKRVRPDRTVNLEPGEGGAFVNAGLHLMNLPKISVDDVPALQDRIQYYFNFCADNDVKPSVAGLGLALGINRTEVWKYANTEVKSQEVRSTLKEAYRILDYLMDQYMQNGKINPVSGIFLMKNNLGYTDKQEVEIHAQNPFGEIQDRRTLEERYLDALPGENIVDAN